MFPLAPEDGITSPKRDWEAPMGLDETETASLPRMEM
jgi:hypothetical protein